MPKFAVFYMFSDTTASMAMQRLRRLRRINPNVVFIPVVGVPQFLFLPMVVDNYMFGSTTKLRGIGAVSHLANMTALSAPGVFRLSHKINKEWGGFIRHNRLNDLGIRIEQEGLPELHADFTPLVLWNLDHAIMNWFKTCGKRFDFDHLIFYEFDMFTTKPLKTIYGPYANSYDACFFGYEKAAKNWRFYNFPPGASHATRKWLKQRMLPTTLYSSLFAGNMISRRVLEKLEGLGIDFSSGPPCQAEMRLPTVLSSIGFKCGSLSFSFFRYRPTISEEEIRSNEDAGIFHPVKTLTSYELNPADHGNFLAAQNAQALDLPHL